MKNAILFLGLSIGGFAGAYTRFQYHLNGGAKNYRVNWVFIDLFDTSASTIQQFKNQGKRVICYFSAGTSENWRSDFKCIPASDQGNDVEGWEGEQWLNTKSSTVLNVMISRLDMARNKGCYGVDPDNVDGYDNDTGFSLSKSTSMNYLKSLALAAHSRGLKIGLKNSSEIASSMSGTLDFVVAEECFQYNECSSYSGFAQKSKPVFLVEYSGSSRSLCNSADKMNMNLAFFNLGLNGGTFKVCH